MRCLDKGWNMSRNVHSLFNNIPNPALFSMISDPKLQLELQGVYLYPSQMALLSPRKQQDSRIELIPCGRSVKPFGEASTVVLAAKVPLVHYANSEQQPFFQ
jgi:hypothetical protein